jgi:hypothetical protein
VALLHRRLPIFSQDPVNERGSIHQLPYTRPVTANSPGLLVRLVLAGAKITVNEDKYLTGIIGVLLSVWVFICGRKES